MIRIVVQAADFDAGAEIDALGAGGDAGAVASFVGLVRGGGGLTALEIEHYPGLTERLCRDAAEEAARRFELAGATVIHRHGRLAVGDRIVLAAAAAPHRQAALDGVSFLIDWLKTRAAFWKREHFADGRMRWVEARAEDDAAAARWG